MGICPYGMGICPFSVFDQPESIGVAIIVGENSKPDGRAIKVNNVTKDYALASGEFRALDRLSLDIAYGNFVAIVGRSGSGKTTLLNLLAGIDRPTSGEVI